MIFQWAILINLFFLSFEKNNFIKTFKNNFILHFVLSKNIESALYHKGVYIGVIYNKAFCDIRLTRDVERVRGQIEFIQNNEASFRKVLEYSNILISSI